MIQLQALNYIIKNNDLSFLDLFDEKYYFNYSDEYKYVASHAKKYKKAPDINTMLEKFENFTPIDVTESSSYLSTKLYEDYVYNETVKIINNTIPMFKENAVKAKESILNKLQAIKPPMRSYGEDIITNAKQRYDLLIDRQANPEHSVISTGLDEVDMVLGGGMRRGEELIVIYARTNNAKTWIAEKFATSCWEAKNNVGFFSPEMSPTQIGYRFDTLFKHFDNHGISGSSPDFNSDEYKKYINTLTSKTRPGFIVTTPTSYPDRRVTVSELRRWIEDRNLDLLVIDGLSYLSNERYGSTHKNTTENLTDIAEDLMTLSIEKKIPIVVVMQANRQGARDSEGEVSTEAPEIDTIRGSDGISHNASRAISIYKAKDIIKLYFSKNRYGEKGQHLFYQYDINFGKFTYVPNPKSGLPLDLLDPADVPEDGSAGSGAESGASSGDMFKDTAEVY